ncbi:MAG: DUF2877 domain-containing protein [Bryobacteraceae bacterium]
MTLLDVGDSVGMGRYGLHYNSRLSVGPLEPAKLELNLRVFEGALLASAPARSLAFLIDDRGGRTFASAFEKEVARRLSAGVARLAHGDLEGGASQIRGLGYGLTPSGDDFLAGFLLGMHALEMATGIDLAAQRRAVHEAARGGNPFSEALLRSAAEGRCFERAGSLIRSLFEGVEPDVLRHARRLFAVGASSGADLGVGLLFALKGCPCGAGWKPAGGLLTRLRRFPIGAQDTILPHAKVTAWS